MPILVFLGLSVFDLGGPDVRDRQTDVRQTDRQTDVRRASSYNAPALSDVGIISKKMYTYYLQFCLDIISQSRIAQYRCTVIQENVGHVSEQTKLESLPGLANTSAQAADITK